MYVCMHLEREHGKCHKTLWTRMIKNAIPTNSLASPFHEASHGSFRSLQSDDQAVPERGGSTVLGCSFSPKKALQAPQPVDMSGESRSSPMSGEVFTANIISGPLVTHTLYNCCI